MKTLFIADNDTSVRNNLKDILEWDSLGFKCCGEAADGEAALAQLLSLNPDLVILDTDIPKIHGTETLHRARKAGFRGRCIIISAQCNFQYAKEAINANADFYLNKPIDRDELYRAVCEIRDTFIKGAAPLFLNADAYQIVIYENFDSPSSATQYSFTEFLKAVNKGRDISSSEHLTIENREIILLKGLASINEFSYFLKHIKRQASKEEHSLNSVFLTYGRPVHSFEDIHKSYEDASTLLEYRFFCSPEQHVLGYDVLKEEPNIPPHHSFLPFDEKQLTGLVHSFVGYIESFNRKMIVKTLSELEAKLAKPLHNIDGLKLFFMNLYFQIREHIKMKYDSSEIPFETNSFVLEYIYNRNFLYEITSFFTEQFDMIIAAIKNPSIDTVMDNVLFYIEHNYTNNIKLETIAQLFGYNNAYLGKIFHKAAGESFNTYIDHKRVEYSKQLILENKLKVYEIAKEVGYKNVDYFHKKFKKYVGKSPAEYRKQMTDSPSAFS